MPAIKPFTNEDVQRMRELLSHISGPAFDGLRTRALAHGGIQLEHISDDECWDGLIIAYYTITAKRRPRWMSATLPRDCTFYELSATVSTPGTYWEPPDSDELVLATAIPNLHAALLAILDDCTRQYLDNIAEGIAMEREAQLAKQLEQP